MCSFVNINQLDALNFIISLFQASTCFDHMCLKHVEAWNKLIMKFSASSWLILINKYIEMHGQQNIKTTLCVFLVSTNLSATCPIQRRIEGDFFKSVHSSSSKVPVTLVRFYETCIFLTDCRKIHKCQISWKSCHWELSVHSSSSKVRVTLVRLYETCAFSTDCRKIHKCQISWKSCHWELSSSMRMGRQMDRHDETKSLFSQFCVRA